MEISSYGDPIFWVAMQITELACDELEIVCEQGHLDKALTFLFRAVCTTNRMYWALLKACNQKTSLFHAVQIYKHVVQNGLLKELPCPLGDYLASTLAKCGGLEEAEHVFFSLSRRSVISWTAMFSCYVVSGQPGEALKLFPTMLKENIEPNEHTFVSLLKACGSKCYLQEAKKLHADAQRRGFTSDVYVGSTLINTFGKCGGIIEAENVFYNLSQRNIVSWCALLSAYVECQQPQKALQLFRQMKEEIGTLDDTTLIVTLQACSFLIDDEKSNLLKWQSSTRMLLDICRALHAYALNKSTSLYISVCNILLNVYGKYGSIGEAENVFAGLAHSDVVSWSALLSAYADQGQVKDALRLYGQMHQEGISPDQQAYAVALQACLEYNNDEYETQVDSMCLDIGRALHADAERSNLTSGTYVGCSLISLYGKYGSVLEAESVFSGLYKRDIVSWTTMLSLYLEQDEPQNALLLFRQMEDECVDLDHLLFVIALQACTALVDKCDLFALDKQETKLISLEVGRGLHSYARRKGFLFDDFVCNSLVTMYSKCGSIIEAENVFDRLQKHDVVSWNAMLSAYIELEEAEEALECYRWMLMDAGILNDVTVLCVLQACFETGSIEVCRETHFIVTWFGYDENSAVINTLIRAYGACASLPDALTVFIAWPNPDIAPWSALMASYAREGNCSANMHSFMDMQSMGIRPDHVTFSSLLSACSHTGLIDKGIKYFESMKNDYGIVWQIKHYAGMIDLLGRAGKFNEVEALLIEMPTHEDFGVWLSMLGVCCTHGNIMLGRQAFNEAVRIKPAEAGSYILMSNIYSQAGLKECLQEVLKQKDMCTSDKNEQRQLTMCL